MERNTMNKIIKISFVCASLFAFVNAQAQVIESVSYTPAKTGNYQTVATKSVTSFAGNLNVTDEIRGLGFKLNLDTGSNLPFATNTTLGASRDVYMLRTPAVTGTTALGMGGNLYTTNNTTVTNSKVNRIYGGDTNFSNVGGLLTNNGILKFNGVEMKNPKCNIRWVKLPAYTENNDYPDQSNPTAHDYWFAYCGTVDPDPNNPDGGEWHITTENATLLGTCTAGWDGAVQESGESNDAPNKCFYNQGATKSSFTCTAQTLRRCTGSVVYGWPLATTTVDGKGLDYMCKYREDKITKTLAGYEADWNDKAKCGGNATPRPKAVPVYNQSIPASELKVKGALGKIQSQCSSSNSGGSYSVAVARMKIGWRKLFCGFWANDPAEAETQMKGMKHATCEGTNITTPYCEDLYGAGYNISGLNALSNEQICQGIKDKTPTGINVNNFTCIKVGPDRDKYKAIRAKTCNKYMQATYEKCTTKCNDTRCRAWGGFSTGSVQIIDEPFASNVTQAVECNPASSIWKGYNQPPASDLTIYLEQPAASTLLTCQWTD